MNIESIFDSLQLNETNLKYLIKSHFHEIRNDINKNSEYLMELRDQDFSKNKINSIRNDLLNQVDLFEKECLQNYDCEAKSFEQKFSNLMNKREAVKFDEECSPNEENNTYRDLEKKTHFIEELNLIYGELFLNKTMLFFKDDRNKQSTFFGNLIIIHSFIKHPTILK
jgi:hypothetical protein